MPLYFNTLLLLRVFRTDELVWPRLPKSQRLFVRHSRTENGFPQDVGKSGRKSFAPEGFSCLDVEGAVLGDNIGESNFTG